jgi:Protein of unknown function (DUF3422)
VTTRFDTLDNFEQVLAGAHVSVVPRVRPPALTWHLAFWRPVAREVRATPKAVTAEKVDLAAEVEQAIARSAQERYDRRSQIDKYLYTIWKRLDGSGRRPGVENFDCRNRRSTGPSPDDILLLDGYIDSQGTLHQPTRPGRKPRPRDTSQKLELRTVLFSFDWWGARCTLRMEQHTEYTTLSCSISLWRSTLTTPTSKLDAIPPVLVALNKLNHLTQSKTYYSRRRYAPLYRALYTTIWDKFYEQILAAGPSRKRHLGKVFADFRGLVLARQDPSRKKPPVDPNLLFHPPGLPTATLHSSPAGTERYRFEPFRPKPRWAEIVDHLWRFLTVANGTLELSRQEFTACRMLGGNALYVSALGAQPPTPPANNMRVPLYYLVYANTHNHWQIGRLVDQMQHLGTVRLATTVEFEELRTASYELRALEGALNSAPSGNARSEGSEDGDGQAELRELANETREQGDQLNGAISKINREIAKANEKVSGGIEYRIGRSRYYARQFFSGLRVLRIGRIEGFQPYDRFVERRVRSALSFIESLHSQMQRLWASRDALVRRAQLMESERVAVETSIRTLEIDDIQEVADFALWAVLAPYYIGSILIKDTFRLPDNGPVTGVAWVALWALFCSGALALHVRRAKRRKREPKVGWLLGAVLISAGALALGALSLLGGSPEAPKPSRVTVETVQTFQNQSSAPIESPSASNEMQKSSHQRRPAQ